MTTNELHPVLRRDVLKTIGLGAAVGAVGFGATPAAAHEAGSSACMTFPEVGTSVEGADTVHPGLAITGINGQAVALQPDTEPSTYGGNDPYTNAPSACMDVNGGFGSLDARDNHQPQDFDFDFAEPVSEFGLHMIDYGDLNRGSGTSHRLTCTGFDADGNVVDQQIMEFETDSDAVNPTTWQPIQGVTKIHDSLFGGAGDICDAAEGEPGDYYWSLSGSGITHVEIRAEGTGYDPNCAFDLLCYTPEVTCTTCDLDDSVKYEYVYEDDDDGNVIRDGFYAESGDDPLGYSDYVNKDGETQEPLQAHFENPDGYCLDSLTFTVKAGREIHEVDAYEEDGHVVVSIDGNDDFVNSKNNKQYAISYIEISCAPDE